MTVTLEIWSSVGFAPPTNELQLVHELPITNLQILSMSQGGLHAITVRNIHIPARGCN
jgi:hypothetical protein